MNTLWFTWENQRRNRELSKALEARLYEFKEIDDIRNPAVKYSKGLAKTAKALLDERPSLVCCQNPSIVLSAFLVTIKKAAGFRVWVDAHNVGLFPKEGKSFILGLLSRYIQKAADLTLVTNEQLKNHVEKNGGRAFILQDRIPDIPQRVPITLEGKYNILFICSYAEDEPYHLVFEAAANLDSDIHIYVTGNFKKKKIDPLSVPANVTLLGYVSEDEYIDMLNSVDATIDLTTRENCLVCGAYETISVEKPQILSDTHALRSYFNKGAVYTPHSAKGISDAVQTLILNKSLLKKEAKDLKQERQVQWEGKLSALKSLMQKIAG